MDNGKLDISNFNCHYIAFNVVIVLQIQQQVNKEYQQMKAIQKELTEMTMDLHNAPFRRNAVSIESERKDPAAWFRPDPDIWSPPPNRDPDVFAPPIDRYVYQIYIFIISDHSEPNVIQLRTDVHYNGQMLVREPIIIEKLVK